MDLCSSNDPVKTLDSIIEAYVNKSYDVAQARKRSAESDNVFD